MTLVTRRSSGRPASNQKSTKRRDRGRRIQNRLSFPRLLDVLYDVVAALPIG